MNRPNNRQNGRRECNNGPNCRAWQQGQCQFWHPGDGNQPQPPPPQNRPQNQPGRGQGRPNDQRPNQQPQQPGPPRNNQPDFPQNQPYRQNQPNNPPRSAPRECRFGADCRDFRNGNCHLSHSTKNQQPPTDKLATRGVDQELKTRLGQLCNLSIDTNDISRYTELLTQIDPERCDMEVLDSIAIIIQKAVALPPKESMKFVFDLHSMNFLYGQGFLILIRESIFGRGSEKAFPPAIRFLDALLRFFEEIILIDRETCLLIDGDGNLGFIAQVAKKLVGELELALTEDEKRAKAAVQTFEKRVTELKHKIETTLIELKKVAKPSQSALALSSAQGANADDPIDPEGLTPPKITFRKMSLFYSIQDVMCERPYLRKIRLHSSYPSLEVYLDIHFRLFIEDFYSSVKKGIKDYCLNLASNNKTSRVEGLAMYDAQATEQVATNSGVGFKLKISLAKNQKVSEKEFIFGTMVLLTIDNFQTFLICIVKQAYENKKDGPRKAAQHLEILVEPKPGFGTASSAMRPFLNRQLKLGATTNYFESYFHCLVNMQKMTHLPLANLIVYGRIEENRTPDYLCTVERTQQGARQKKTKPEVQEELQKIMAGYTLDPSQRDAILHAMGKELAIVQGPPGCGKTFVSLLIVRTLLALRSHIGGPIFIICYTNHALDQFLEHIMSHTNRIVRLGGRCKNPNLAQFTLASRRAQGTLAGSKESGYYNLQRRTLERQFNYMSEKIGEMQAFRFINSPESIQGFEGPFDAVEKRYHLAFENLIKKVDKKQQEKFRDFFKKRVAPLNDFGLGILFWLELIDLQLILDEFIDQNQPKKPPKAQKNQKGNPDADLGWRELGQPPNEPEPAQPEEPAAAAEGFVDNANIAMEPESEDYFRSEKGTRLFLEAPPLAKFKNVQYESNQEMIEEEARRFALPADRTRKMAEDLLGGNSKGRALNLNSLNLQERWAINNHLIQRSVADWERKMLQLTPEIETWTKKSKDAEEVAIAETLKQADIIGVTTTGAARFMSLLTKIKSKVTLIEEAAEVLECQIITSLTATLTHLILIGDHMQLRPKVNDIEIAEKYRLEISLFERLVGLGYPKVQIVVQRRMRPEISELIRLFYPELKDDPTVLNRPNIRGISHNVFFFTHTWMEDTKVDQKTSKVNSTEAKMVMKFADFLIKNGYSPEEITILSLYSGQLTFIKGQVASSPFLSRIRLATVDDYQGEENKIILLSLVRSNPQNKIGFLKFDNRINVAFSRAREGLYVFGNAMCIREYHRKYKTQNPNLLLARIVMYMAEKNWLSDRLELVCQVHGNKTVVTCEADFSKTPAGGCKEPCNCRMLCGHQCKRFCHNFVVTDDDPDGHKKDLCLLACARDHGCNHGCKKLCSNCKPEDFKCPVKINVSMPQCGHSFPIICKDKNLPENQVCQAKCSLDLRCGHPCQRKCFEKCIEITDEQRLNYFSTACTFPIDTPLPCGHIGKRPCGQDPEYFRRTFICRARCDKPLDCSHPCVGVCSECRFTVNGKLQYYHANCRKACTRFLPCGHGCKDLCSDVTGCSPCNEKCYICCLHSYCPKKCGEVCTPCVQQCEAGCPHSKCKLKCFEICEREPCNEPCPLVLPCSHPCIGLCGEPCPKICRICNKDDKAFEIFFGNEDEPTSKFVTIDCGHSFVATDLDTFFEQQSEANKEVQYPLCPLCKQRVRLCSRYQKVIKQTTQRIGAIKKKFLLGIDAAYKELIKKQLSANAKTQFQRHFALRQVPEKVDGFIKKLNKKPYEINGLNGVMGLCEYLGSVMANLSRPESDDLINSILHKLVPHLLNPCISESNRSTLENVVRTIGFLVEMINMRDKMEGDILTDFAKERQILEEGALRFRKYIADQEGFFCDLYFSTFENFIEKRRESIKSAKIEGPQKFQMINKILGLGSGHWYVCPNGHAYVIGECGGAMQQSKCNECGATIGGQNHALRNDNRYVALDGNGPAYDPNDENRNFLAAQRLQEQLRARHL